MFANLNIEKKICQIKPKEIKFVHSNHSMMILSFRRLQRAGEESQRKFHALQERLDSTVQRYEEEISYLRSQKARLEEQLDMERNSNYSTLGNMACMFNSSQEEF